MTYLIRTYDHHGTTWEGWLHPSMDSWTGPYQQLYLILTLGHA